MEKGYKVVSECVDLSHEGLGVFKIDGMTVFCPNALVGEKVKIEIEKVNSNFATGKVVEIIKKSPNRVRPICKNYEVCGGCDLMHMDYNSELKFKEKMAIETLKRIGNLKEVPSKGILGMEDSYYYRNKVQIPFSSLKGKTICGFYKKKSHFIIPLDECFIQPALATDIAKFIKNLANEYNVEGYNDLDKKGILRHVLIRKNYLDEYMVILILKKDALNNEKEIIEKIKNRYQNVKSILINIQEKDSNVILGNKTRVVYGKGEMIDDLLGYKFILSYKSFFQINRTQTEKLYNVAKEYANLKGNETVLDAYCGVGTIGISLSKNAKKVYGIEIVPEAIENAKRNATLNNIDNIEFSVGKAEEVILNMEDINFDVCVFDPPRKGCDKVFLDSIIKKNVKRLVYVSCNVATLARDIDYLSEHYKVEKVEFVDMFPHSADVETVCLLTKK